jgi:DNA-binding transcriptional LysR family regulator
MQRLDFSLLIALDALLSEGSVTAAANRLNRSVSATSRMLDRIRHAVGDPILVRAGRHLVPTPRAEALRPRVRLLVEEASDLLRPAELHLPSLRRTFTIRANDAFISTFASPLAGAIRAEAPGVTLCFAPEGDEDIDALRKGRIDLDIGVGGEEGPELKAQTLFRERFNGAVCRGHDLADGPVDPVRFAAYPHVVASRRGRLKGPIDEALAALGLSRTIALVVPSHTAALLVTAGSDLVASIPASLAKGEVTERLGIRTFDAPLDTGAIAISQTWHPRLDGDAAHRWLRAKVRLVCSGRAPPTADRHDATAGPAR